MILSIAVCCHNSTRVVGDCLAGLAQQVRARTDVECLVVDSASSDGAALEAMVRRSNGQGSGLRYVREDRVGLSVARNRAVAESSAEYVHFIDDDAVPAPGMVAAFLTDLAESKPDVFGGNVIPLFPVEPPSGMDQAYWHYWSIRYFGTESRWLGDGEYFIGANIGARRSLLVEHPFDERLGRSGASLVGGEEVFLGEARWRRRFVADAYVMHKVSPARMTAQMIAKRRNGHLRTHHGRVVSTRVWGGFVKDVLQDFATLSRSLRLRARILRERIKEGRQ